MKYVVVPVTVTSRASGKQYFSHVLSLEILSKPERRWNISLTDTILARVKEHGVLCVEKNSGRQVKHDT